MFSARVFVTTSIGMSTSNALLDSNRSSERSENDTSSRGHSTHERESERESESVNAIAPLHRPVERGRPDLKAEISRLTPHQHRALVFVCGPSSMVAEASALSMKSGVDFRHETFEL
jgi:ferredoxin-NADP reductase